MIHLCTGILIGQPSTIVDVPHPIDYGASLDPLIWFRYGPEANRAFLSFFSSSTLLVHVINLPTIIYGIGRSMRGRPSKSRDEKRAKKTEAQRRLRASKKAPPPLALFPGVSNRATKQAESVAELAPSTITVCCPLIHLSVTAPVLTDHL